MSGTCWCWWGMLGPVVDGVSESIAVAEGGGIDGSGLSLVVR